MQLVARTTVLRPVQCTRPVPTNSALKPVPFVAHQLPQRLQKSQPLFVAAAGDNGKSASTEEETVFYEGSGSNAELALSILLSATLIYFPLTLASIGRRLWVSYKFTNKRLIITTNSPVLKREVQVEYSKIKEIRSIARAFGAWGDCVFFLKDGSRLELAGLENYKSVVDYVEGFIQTEA